MLLEYISHDATAQSMAVLCATVIILFLLVHRWMKQQDRGQ